MGFARSINTDGSLSCVQKSAHRRVLGIGIAGFITTTGTCRSDERKRFLNRGLLGIIARK
jgi:hypothetical protein